MPDRRKQQVFNLIRVYGGQLVRQKKHLIYRFPNGAAFTVAKTPSDSRAWRNSLGTLKRLLRRIPA